MCEWNWLRFFLFFSWFVSWFVFSFTSHLSISLSLSIFLSVNRREIFAIYFRILNIAIKYYNLYLLIRTCTIHISVNFFFFAGMYTGAMRKQSRPEFKFTKKNTWRRYLSGKKCTILFCGPRNIRYENVETLLFLSNYSPSKTKQV